MSSVSKFSHLIRRYVGNPEIIFEFGARDCFETIDISGEFPGAKIYTFECNEATLPVCRGNVAAHPMISLVESAVGDRDGNATFHPIDQLKTVTEWPDGNPGASSLFLASGKYELESYVQRSAEVAIIRPDTFMAAQGLTKVDAVWMDIQGAELMALRGFGEKIHDVALVSLEAEFVEIYDGQPLFWDIHGYLTEKGFLLVDFLSFGRFACDAAFVQGHGRGALTRFRSWFLFRYARFMIAIHFPLRKSVGDCLRKIGLRK